MAYKGIILAGGTGSRLSPLTKIISKQLLPIYDKPMIYYPLSTLMLMGIKDILIITTPDDLIFFKRLLDDGTTLGIKITYKIQNEPGGIAQAIMIGEEFIQNDKVILILGDNIFYGHDLVPQLRKGLAIDKGASIFIYRVNDPERFGIVEFDKNMKATNIQEKPKNPKSNYAITGLFVYSNDVLQKAKLLKPSKRGELEITDLNKIYLEQSELHVEILGRGTAWLDTGTFESLQEASLFIKTIENRQGLKISCPEEIAWRMGWITSSQLRKLAEKFPNSSYGEYLFKLIS